MGKCTFTLSENMKISFKFFNLIKTVSKPISKSVNATNNKQLECRTKEICKETGTELYQNHIGTHFDLKGVKVKMSPEDV